MYIIVFEKMSECFGCKLVSSLFFQVACDIPTFLAISCNEPLTGFFSSLKLSSINNLEKMGTKVIAVPRIIE
jgi:hypothetical protein